MALTTKERECVRVKLKFSSGDGSQSYCQFSVDPKLTTYDVLVELISRRFEVSRDFKISYLVMDKYGEQSLLPLQTDLDLDAAIFASSDLTLRLFIEAKTKPDDDWDIVGPGELTADRREISKRASEPPFPFPPGLTAGLRSLVNVPFLQSISQQVGKTVTSIEKAIGLKGCPEPPRSPLSDAELRRYMDNLGRIVQFNECFQSVYLGGVEPSLRKVVWRILLNVYPPEMTGRERIALMTSKIAKYQSMKEAWKQAYKEGRLTQAQIQDISLASVDVVRTDRNHPFYSMGSDSSKIRQLFDILATYAIYHPSIGYHQGMSNLASPLLFVQDNEGAAYICFCALMQRLGKKFCPQNQLLTIVQMQHLHDLLVFTDWELAQFLRLHNLGNMFFTERWLLLELVREFAFEDALYVLEVQWASLNLVACQDASPEQTATSKGYFVLSEDAASISLASKPPPPATANSSRTAAYCPSDVKLINSLIGTEFAYNPPSVFPQQTGIDHNLSPGEDSLITKCDQTSKSSAVANGVKSRTSAMEQRRRRWSSAAEGDPIHMKDWVVELPPPDQLGRGNPFLLFICVSMLLEYRERILAEVNEASDMFHLFQQMTRQHNHISIVNRARALFDAYLRSQEDKRHKLTEQAELAACL
ncbi:hypothetical protein SprV_0100319100 [Sparganum proliferum]